MRRMRYFKLQPGSMLFRLLVILPLANKWRLLFPPTEQESIASSRLVSTKFLPSALSLLITSGTWILSG